MSSVLEMVPAAPARRNQVEDVKVLADRQVMVSLAGAVRGTWLSYESGIDAVLTHIRRELVCEHLTNTFLLLDLKINHSCVSRCRHGEYRLPETWLLRMHEYSGIPVAELRQVAGLGAGVPPHPNARK